MNTNYRVPSRFEDYLHARGLRDPAAGSEPCTCCGDRPAVTVDTYCRECLRYQHGFDEAEERTVHAVLGGAVRGYLAEGTDTDLVRSVVDQVIDEHHLEDGRRSGWYEGRSGWPSRETGGAAR